MKEGLVKQAQMVKLFFNSLDAVQEVNTCFFLLSRHALISIILYTTDVNKASGVNNNNVYRMSASGCTGVEKKLTECPRYLQVNKITSCNNKVTVKCNGEFDCFKTLV